MDRSVTIIGFGNQGRAQALNLRSSGWEVTVALRPNSPSVDAVSQEGLPVVADLSSAVGKAEMVALLIPDTEQPTLWRELLAKSLPAGAALVFAHGYNLHFHRIMPRPDLDIILVAPLSSGATLRANFTSGDPTPIAVAVHHDATGNAGALAHTYAKALVRDARQVFDTTVREETETDLFSEQVLSCGGLMCLIRAAFQAMVDAGYSRMMAHYICLQEVKDLATLFAREGLSGGMARTSRTAQYGALTRGPRVIGEGARAAMRDALDEIRGGRFAAELAKEAADGFAQTERLMKELAAHPLSGACK